MRKGCPKNCNQRKPGCQMRCEIYKELVEDCKAKRDYLNRFREVNYYAIEMSNRYKKKMSRNRPKYGINPDK